ncbi:MULTISPECIES: DegT/DnrJ/EryC1/StrS family aminotransferase [unclassified Streptomyces]|uniref:DegT/DnrJ/EryC1/StrS family aminotransferase n=1 Tax=unclassified Streptomyces TaxID=2593676 RepID=UPI002E2A1E96|nr:DegT/DnrJ/EryC1/StrS family aminotransferase [Streptomyces sp. NBC_01439]
MSATASSTSTAGRDLARTVLLYMDAAVRDESFIVGPQVRALEEYVSGVTGKSAVCVSSGPVGLMLVRRAGFAGAPLTVASDAGAAVRAVVEGEGRLVQQASALWADGVPVQGSLLVRDLTVPAEAAQCPGAVGTAEVVGIGEFASLVRQERVARRVAAADAVVVHAARDYGYGAGDFGIVACSEETARRLRVLRNHGRDGLGTYLHAQVGFNNRMDEVQARLLLDRIAAEVDDGAEGTAC